MAAVCFGARCQLPERALVRSISPKSFHLEDYMKRSLAKAHRGNAAYKLRYRYRPGPQGSHLPLANVGRSHPDYGMTPKEHALAKAERQQKAV